MSDNGVVLTPESNSNCFEFHVNLPTTDRAILIQPSVQLKPKLHKFGSADNGIVTPNGGFASADPQALQSLIECEGMEHIDAARASGRGVILFTGHVGA